MADFHCKLPPMCWTFVALVTSLAVGCTQHAPMGPTAAATSETYFRNGLHVIVEGSKQDAPAFVLIASPTADIGLSDPYLGYIARKAETLGWTAVSIEALDGGNFSTWLDRVVRREDFPALYAAAVTDIVTDLIQRRIISANKLTIEGVSRNGFLAVHVAARDPRFVNVLLLAPVTDLAIPVEFADIQRDPFLGQLSALNMASRFAGRSVFTTIGYDDQRVGTVSAGQFSDLLRATGAASTFVVTQDEGHASTLPMYDTAAAWWQAHLAH